MLSPTVILWLPAVHLQSCRKNNNNKDISINKAENINSCFYHRNIIRCGGKDMFKVYESILMKEKTYLSVLSLFFFTENGWGLLMTVKEASAPESDMKRMLSNTDRDRDGEWYAWLLNKAVRMVLFDLTSMESAIIHLKTHSLFSLKYFSRLPRMKKQYC